MLRYLEKKLNTRLIDLMIAGTSIQTKNMSPDGKSFFEKLKRFFAKGLEQMAKDLNPKQKKQLDDYTHSHTSIQDISQQNGLPSTPESNSVPDNIQ